MAKTQSTENHKPRSISARIVLAGGVSLLLFSLLLYSVIGLMNKYIVMRKHINSLKQQQSDLKQKKLDISNMNDYISTPEGQEQVFRDKYRVVKPGEGMIVITNQENLNENVVNKKPGVQRFWEAILIGLGLR